MSERGKSRFLPSSRSFTRLSDKDCSISAPKMVRMCSTTLERKRRCLSPRVPSRCNSDRSQLELPGVVPTSQPWDPASHQTMQSAVDGSSSDVRGLYLSAQVTDA